MRAHATRGRRRHGGVALQIAPMIDVVFLLLMYFMVATDFSPSEEVFRLDLPVADVGTANPLDLLEEPLRVRLSSEGPGGGVLVSLQGPWKGPESIEALGQFLASSIVPAGSLLMPDHPIVLAPEPDVPWGAVVSAFNAAIGAGSTNVTLETDS